MTSKRTAHTLAAAACAALLLTACGGESDDGKGSDQIEGAGKTNGKAKSPSASASSGAEGKDPDAPDFEFPKGVKVVVEDEMTGDAKKDEVLRDHGYAIKATVLSYAKANPDLPLANRYVQDAAGESLSRSVGNFKKARKVGTGTYRYYDRKATVGKQAAEVRYCQGQRNAFAKIVKTGKVLRTKPSAADFTSIKEIMQKRGGSWRVVSTTMKGSDPKCAR